MVTLTCKPLPCGCSNFRMCNQHYEMVRKAGTHAVLLFPLTGAFEYNVNSMTKQTEWRG